MLGIAKGAIGGNYTPPPASDVKAAISPASFISLSRNGSYTTPFFNAVVSNGIGPFTYSWSFDEGAVSTPSNIKTRLVMSGYNTQVNGTLYLTVTDTGDSNKTATASASVSLFFEDQLR